MEEALKFFQAFEIWIYLVLGLASLYFIRRFILAWEELREAAFGLERESAQTRVNQATLVLVCLLVIAIGEFVIVSIIAPGMPQAGLLPTPTLDLMASPTTTLPVVEATSEIAFPVDATATVTNVPAGVGCLPGQLEITTPANGATVSGVVEIIGSANTPNFGFYKLEMKRAEATNWLTLLAGNEVITNATLGFWNTSLLSPGTHELSLVVTDNQGQSLPPCVVQINITLPVETTQP